MFEVLGVQPSGGPFREGLGRSACSRYHDMPEATE
jgi:hypothetical protein